jgi:hypothetical protein
MQVKVFGEKALEIADGDVFKTTIEYVEGRKVAVLTRTKTNRIRFNELIIMINNVKILSVL